MKNKNNAQDLQAKKIAEQLEKAKNINDLFAENGLVENIIKPTIQEILQAELTEYLGYDKYDKTSKKTSNSRNGSYSKKIRSSAGDMNINVPRDRQGEFQPSFLDHYSVCTNELEKKIIHLYATGTTVRDIQRFLQEIYSVKISPTLISTVTDRVLPLVEEWQSRPLDSVYAILYLDCIHIKQKCEGEIKNTALYVVLGIKMNGEKEILGFWSSTGGESSNYWLKVVSELKNRGLEDVLIFCFDGLPGFKEAVQSVYPKCDIQRCVIHQIRNTLKYVGWKDRKEFMADLKTVYKAPTKEKAKANLAKLENKWESKYAIAIKSWVDNWDDLTTYFDFTPEIRKLIYTTNILEGFNRQLRKYTKTKSIFPTENSVKKTFYLTIMEITKKWKMPVRSWERILNQLAVRYEGRVKFI